MAESERLGASFSIDVTNLKTGLTQANRLIRESQSEFKAAAAGMDDWTKSEDGLNAKIKSLTDITEIQKKKVSALKTEYQNLINGGLDPTSKAATDLRIKINNEEAELKSNEAELRKQKEALKEVGDESEKAGGKIEKLGSIAENVGKVAAAAFAAAAAAVGALVKASMGSYAEYEQLVGGVETLFGAGGKSIDEYAKSVGKSTEEVRDEYDKLMKSQEAVLENADNAYKTAGLSANEYMETVTGMSASLIQSLGGDTEKAAKIADMAIIDMSDNANKMGTSIESIQNAYGGFAKGNFTMLDNLKLGYGGTKEEMERLLENAEKISGVEYDISSYADVAEAIHIIQNEMGITGTTAKEASSTISGSVASMKSAYSNLLTGIADDNQDIGKLIDEMIESAMTVLDNIIPRILINLDKIPEAVAKLLPEIPPIIEQLIPSLMEAVVKLLDNIVKILPSIIDAVVELVPSLVTAVLGMLPNILRACVEIVTNLINAITEMLPEIIDAIIQVVPLLINELIKAIPQLLQAAIKLLIAIVDAIPVIVTALVDALPEIVSTIVSTLLENLPMLLQGAIQLFMAIVQAIPEINRQLIASMPKIIKGIVDGLVKGVPQMIEAAKKIFGGFFDGVIDKFTDIKDYISEISTELWEPLKDGASKVWEGMKSVFSNLGSFFSDTFSKAWQKVKDVFSTGGKVFDGIKDGIVNAFKSIVNALIRGINKVVATPFNALNTVLDKLRKFKVAGLAPFSGISNISVPQIPELAKGGVVKGATNAIIGEDGAEAVVPLERNKEWIKAVAKELAEANGEKVVINQTNNYSQAHSRYEIYKSKQQTAAAVRLALGV